MIRLRPATADDAQLLYDWVNSPSALIGKLRTDAAISWTDHCRWLEQRLRDPGTRIWIAHDGDAAVGQVRFQRMQADDRNTFDVDIFVAEVVRGGGKGKAMLVDATNDLARCTPGVRLRARVLNGNKASQELFQSLGYRLIAKEADHLVYLSEPTFAKRAGAGWCGASPNPMRCMSGH